MKKIISIFILSMLICSTSVSAMDFTDMTKKLVNYFNVQVTDDVSGINKLQNRKNLKNPELISAAIKSGVIVAKEGLVNESGTDFTPLTDGIVKRYINDDNYIFLSGTVEELKVNKIIKTFKDTFYITKNGKQSDFDSADTVTCVVDKDGRVLFMWKATSITTPALYKVKLYWAEENELIATNVYRKEYGVWIDKTKGSFTTFDSSQVGITKEFVMNNLDEYIYIFADNQGENIVIKGISD